jgi:hypothetical protein
MNSYFEIHGEIVDGSVYDDTSPLSPKLDAFAAERPERGRIPQKASGLRRSRGVAEEPESQTHWDATRKMRVRTALTVAASIALADGPLPIGDSLAVAGLLIYSGWELGHEFGILE